MNLAVDGFKHKFTSQVSATVNPLWRFIEKIENASFKPSRQNPDLLKVDFQLSVLAPTSIFSG
jgi:hypothetical protein